MTTWLFEEGTFVPAAKLTKTEKLSIVSNYMGTPEAMYREDGEAVWTCELNSYGKVRNFQGGSKTDCPFRYQGQYEDAETGLYYNRFRYYSPEEGMYISQDPIGLNGGINLYSYVHDTSGWLDTLGLATVYLRNNEVYVGKAEQNAKTRYRSDKVNSATDIFIDIPDTHTAQGVEDIVYDRLKESPFKDEITNINRPVQSGDKKGYREYGRKWLIENFGSNYEKFIDDIIKTHYESGNGKERKSKLCTS
jgi:RHS repeat-associated protein